MSFGKFSLLFFLVALLDLGEARLLGFQIQLEFSYFLIFFLIRTCSPARALALSFLLSLGLDLLLQAAQVKGIEAMSVLLLVYGVMQVKKQVIPQYENLFSIVFFFLFYIANQYLTLSINRLFSLAYPMLSLKVILAGALIHTSLFALLVAMIRRWRGSST